MPAPDYFSRYADGVVQSRFTAPRGDGRRTALRPRAPLASPPLDLDPARVHLQQIVVKFRDGAGVRVRSGGLARDPAASPDLGARLSRAGVEAARVDADLASANRLIAGLGAQILRPGAAIPAAPLTEAEFDALRQRAEALSGREMADLNSVAFVFLPEAHAETARTLVSRLQSLDSVEFAYVQPIPTGAADIPPTTTIDRTGLQQGFHGPAPAGVDIRFARNFPGGAGEGVRVIDVEGGWYMDHEDMQAPSRVMFRAGLSVLEPDHGTAVIGQMWGDVNAFGVDGMIPAAEMGWSSSVVFVPFRIGYDVATAIVLAGRALRPGDIVLIEQQFPSDAGPCPNADPIRCQQWGMLPVEVMPWEFMAIQAISAAGVIVVEAAGNGQQRVDSVAGGDSGAIMVGARNSTAASPSWFTNFGARIDVNSTGDSISTLGYGGIPRGAADPALRANGADPLQWYTDMFGGTSGASPIVASAAALIQSTRSAAGLSKLTPAEMRTLLRTTGTPQIAASAATPIATTPNLRAAIATYIPDRGTLAVSSAPSGPVRPGQSFSVFVEATNTGTTTWTGAHRVIVQSNTTTPTWTAPPLTLGSASAPISVRGGRGGPFTFTAPNAPGTYPLSFELRTAATGGYALATSPPIQIIVSQPDGSFANARVDIVSAPTQVRNGAPPAPVVVAITNTGSTPMAAGQYRLQLGRTGRVSLPTTSVSIPSAIPVSGSTNVTFMILCAQNNVGFSGFSVQVMGPTGPVGASAGRTLQCV